MKGQQGAVLFFALVTLVLMTLIGVTLAGNASLSMRMSGTGAERISALAASQGVLAKEVKAREGASLANIVSPEHIPGDFQGFGVSTTIAPLTDGDVGCQRSEQASSVNLISCRRIEVSSSTKFGRNDLGEVTVVTGIEQQVLTGS